MDQLKAIKYFVKVVETGSFTLAAAAFNVPASSLSRRVADLEQSLGATLLKRTTRTVNVTEVGQSYYQQVTEVLSLLKDSDEAVRAYQSTPMGVLKVSAMVGFGERILIPLMDEFNELYPQITLDVTLSDEVKTLARDEVDIAIRGGYAPQERVIAIKLMENKFIAVASPSYIAAYGSPKSALALKKHKGLFFNTPAGPTPWLSEILGLWQNVSAPSVLTSNNGKWLVDRAIAGKGILLLPRWVLQTYINTGELIELEVSSAIYITQNPDLAVYLLYQKQRYQVPKVKAAVDFLVSRVKLAGAF
ncbi:MAG: LysR family transcriptional regulator [Oceanospirillaceae bacterium]|nr:LysR family transcriptional regulator [Oceanospirillaceae bacterium]